jgi:zinc transporter ZupT
MILSLAFCVFAALADILGGAITLFRKFEHKHFSMITAIGSGFLLGATLLDRLPDAFEELPSNAAIVIICGYLFMLMMERFVFKHDHGESESSGFMDHHTIHHDQGRSADRDHESLLNQKVGLIAYLGMLIHTCMDGVVVAGSFSISRGTGFLMFLAITMHKIPEGFSMATVLLASGSDRYKAFRSTIGLAASTIAGGILTIWVGTVDAVAIKIVMAFAAGTFLFITSSSLVPAVKITKNHKEIFAFVLSVGAFYLSLLLIKHVGLS